MSSILILGVLKIENNFGTQEIKDFQAYLKYKKMEKRAAMSFATSTAVIIIISIVILGLGIILAKNIIDMTKIPKIEKAAPGYFESSVFPNQGRIGTVFKITFSVYNKSGIDFVNANILKQNNLVESVNLYDDGNHGDERANDGTFANVWDSKSKEEGYYSVNLNAAGTRYDNASSIQLYRTNCMNLVNSGPPEDRINLVFLGSGYKDMTKFKNDILKNFEPFKSNKGRFNVYFVNESVDLGCNLNCEGVNRMACCNDNKVVETASQCPANQIIVLIDTNQFCGTSSFYAKVCSYYKSPIVLMHEFGHTFGGLGDEETDPNYAKKFSASDINFPNCDKPGCKKWESITQECWQGCSLSSFYRPTKDKCIMYTYVNEFDPVDITHLENLMRDYGQSSTEPQVLAKSAPPLDKSYFMNINYNNGKISLNNIYSSSGTFKMPDRKIDKEFYNGRLFSFENKLIENFTFEIPRMIWPPMNEEGNNSSPILKDNLNYTLAVPYSDEGKKFEAYDRNNKKVISVEVGYLAKTCGNGNCEPQENYLECPTDCPLSKYDNLCLPEEDKICDPDCLGRDPDCGSLSSLIKTNMTLIVLIVLLIFFLILILASKGPEQR
jgi:hypothetical protein